MKKTYTATFADGTVLTRKSEREYKAAYRVTVDGGKVTIAQGFSGDPSLAQKAAAKEAGNTEFGSKVDGKFVAYSQRGPVAEVVAVA